MVRRWPRVESALVGWKSRASLMVVSVRRACCSLKYCLMSVLLVADVQAGGDASGDHPRVIATPRRRGAARHTRGEQQIDAIGTAEVEVIPDEGLKELPTVQRRVEDLGEADLQLPDGEAMTVAGRAIGPGQRPRQSMLPAIEEPLHVARAQPIADALQASGIGTPAEAVVEAFEGEFLTARLLLGPLVRVEAQPNRVRQIAADLDEGWTPLAILQIEVVLIDVHRLAREGETHSRLPCLLVAFEAGGLLLSDADEDDTVFIREAGVLLGGDGVFLLAAAEVDDRNIVQLGEGVDRVSEAFEQRWEQSRRSDGCVQLLTAERGDVARRLEQGHVAVEVQAIDTRDGQGHVVAEYGGDAGAGHDRRLPYGWVSTRR